MISLRTIQIRIADAARLMDGVNPNWWKSFKLSAPLLLVSIKQRIQRQAAFQKFNIPCNVMAVLEPKVQLIIDKSECLIEGCDSNGYAIHRLYHRIWMHQIDKRANQCTK